MTDRVIFHIDVNSAFLSWESGYRLKHLGGKLDLRAVPSAVGGDMAKHRGIILAKSIPAKAYRIQTGGAGNRRPPKMPRSDSGSPQLLPI